MEQIIALKITNNPKPGKPKTGLKSRQKNSEMKKILLLISLYWAFTLTVSAQTVIAVGKCQTDEDIKIKENETTPKRNTYFINYDFQNLPSNSPRILPKVRHLNDRIFLQVNNINRLIFDVNGSSSSIAISNPNTSAIDSILNNLTGVKGVNIDSIIQKAMPDKNVLKFAVASHPKSKTDTLLFGIDTLEKKLENNLKKLGDYFYVISQIDNEVYKQKYGSENIKKGILNVAIENLSDDDLLDSNFNYIEKYNGLKNLLKKQPLEILRELVDDTIKILNSESEILTNIYSEEEKNKWLIPIWKKDSSDIDLNMKKVRKISVDSVAKAVNIADNYFRLIDDENNFRYRSSNAIIPNGDLLDISIKIKPKDNLKLKFPFNDTTITDELKVKGRFEWTVSPAINFGISKSLLDYSYSIDSARNTTTNAVISDSFYIKQNRKQNSPAPSIGIMINGYWQTHTNITPGISFGIASTTDLSSLRVYLGGNLSFGGFELDNFKKLSFNRFILSAGIAYAKVDRLKENLIEGNNPKRQIPFTGNNIATDQLTEKVGKIGFFIGVSYNLK